MKRIIAAFLCVTMIFLLNIYNENIFAARPDTDSKPVKPPTTDSYDANFDFQAQGLIVQTQQYGKCKIALESTAETAIVYVSGKNLCGGVAGTDLSEIRDDVAFSRLVDGSITATGSAAKNVVCYVAGKLGERTTNADRIYLPEGKYTLSGCPEGGSSYTYRLRVIVVDKNGEKTYYNDYGDGVQFMLPEAAYVAVCIQVMKGTVVAGLRFAPQIEIGSVATEYESYYGQKYAVKVKDGVGTLEMSFAETAADAKFYNIMSSGTVMTVQGFGLIKACVQPIWHAAQPHFAIIDDDGKEEVYSILMPLLNGRDIPFSVSVISSKLNQTGFLTTQQLAAIAEADNKVMCHGKNHKNLNNDATTYAQRYDEIIGGKQMLAELGFDVDTMVYPYGAYDDEVLEITKSAYKYGISTAGETAWGQQRYNEDPINLYAIERINVGSYYNAEAAEEKAAALEDAKRNIDVCIENNYLCVIMTHIGDAGEDGIEQIVELIDYIESKGHKIVDFDTAIQAHIPPEQG